MAMAAATKKWTMEELHSQKRELYTGAGVAEYWMVDPDRRTITAVRRDQPDTFAADMLVWSPPGASEPLTVDVQGLFA